MDVREVIGKAQDALTAKRVFGEPIVDQGTVVIPVARVGGGGGAGMGENPKKGEAPTGSGEGGGFGLSAIPLGVYVLREGKVRWQPALNVNRIIAGAQIVGAIALFVFGEIIRSRRH